MREGFQVNNNQLILLYELVDGDDKEIKRLKSTKCGVVKKRHHKDGDIVDVEWVYATMRSRQKKMQILNAFTINPLLNNLDWFDRTFLLLQREIYLIRLNFILFVFMQAAIARTDWLHTCNRD